MLMLMLMVMMVMVMVMISFLPFLTMTLANELLFFCYQSVEVPPRLLLLLRVVTIRPDVTAVAC
jgi:hypothetical protein